MNVVDIPQSAARELYEQAASRYAAMVKNRAIGVHQLRRPAYPGICDVELLVVTDHVGWDNRFFFSARHRLPERYHRVFLHEPLILPAWSLRVMRYTYYDKPELLAGRDVIGGYASIEEHDERWCRILEAYCAGASFAVKARRSQQLKAREALVAITGFLNALTGAAMVLPGGAEEASANAAEAIRSTFFEDGVHRVQRVRDAWQVFEAAFDRFDRAMQDRLGTKSIEETVAAARDLLRGDRESPDLDREYAYRRARDIDGYHHELASLGFPFGDLFPRAAHPLSVRTPAAAPLLDRLLRNAYHVHRRIMEYAAP